MNAPDAAPPEPDDSSQWDYLRAGLRYVFVLLVVLTCSLITVNVALYTGGI